MVAVNLPEHERHTFPANQSLRIVGLAERRGVRVCDLLAGLGFSREDLAQPGATLPLSAVVTLCERARLLMRAPALGWHLGLETPFSAHGYLGFAAQSAATLGEALALAVDYAPIRSSALALHVEVDETTVSLVVDERADFGGVRDVILPCTLVGLWRLGMSLVGWKGVDSGSRIHLMFDEPPYFAQFAEPLPAVHFRQSDNRLVFLKSFLDRPLKSGDPASFRLASDQCERMHESLFASRLVERVRHNIVRNDGVFRSVAEVAVAVGMSPRTLRRRLMEEGASFQTLLSEARRERSLVLLGLAHLSIQDIADRLGYSSVANFARAFHGWRGETPTAYRLTRK
jgi:AraC-like DNA-binding protein